MPTTDMAPATARARAQGRPPTLHTDPGGVGAWKGRASWADGAPRRGGRSRTTVHGDARVLEEDKPPRLRPAPAPRQQRRRRSRGRRRSRRLSLRQEQRCSARIAQERNVLARPQLRRFSSRGSSPGVEGMASRPGTGNLGGSERTKAMGRVGVYGACAEKHDAL